MYCLNEAIGTCVLNKFSASKSDPTRMGGHIMKRISYVILSTVVLFGASTLSAALVDNFDSYASQAAFEAAWRPWSSNNSSMTLGTTSHSGSNGVRGVAGASGQNRNIRNLDSYDMYKGTDLSPVTFEFWLYDSNSTLPAAPAGARNYNEIRAFSGNGYPSYASASSVTQGIIAMGLYNTPVSDDNYHVRVYYGGVNAWYNMNTARPNGWHKLTAKIGGSNIKFYVDDQLDTTVAFTDLNKVYAFDSVVLGSGLTSGGYDAAFDDLSVAKTPEPATLVMRRRQHIG